MKTEVDVCLVKYINPDELEREKSQFEKVANFLQSHKHENVTLNVFIHDNDKENVGLAKARNLLLNKCKSQFVCFLDFDLFIQEIQWESIIKKFKEDNNVAIISPVSIRQSGCDKNLIWQEKKCLACNFMIFRKSFLDESGGFDENFFVAYADWDIIKRALDSGRKILQHNNSYVQHYGYSRQNKEKGKIWKKDWLVFQNKHKMSLDRREI